MSMGANERSRPCTATPLISFAGNDQNPTEAGFEGDDTPANALEQVGAMIWEAGR